MFVIKSKTLPGNDSLVLVLSGSSSDLINFDIKDMMAPIQSLVSCRR